MAGTANSATTVKDAFMSHRDRISDSPTAASRTRAGWQIIRNRATNIGLINENASAKAAGTSSEVKTTAKRQASTERPAERHALRKNRHAPAHKIKYAKARTGNPPPPAKKQNQPPPDPPLAFCTHERPRPPVPSTT